MSASKKLIYIFAILIIFIATLVVSAHLATPLLNQHRAEFEKWASEVLNIPVKIEQVKISWYRYQPEISLNQVTLLGKETQKPLVQIQNVSIFFSIPQSLWERQWVPSGVMITGADINVNQTSTGEMKVQGFPAIGGFNNQPYQTEASFSDMLVWFSQASHLILHDINVNYTPYIGQRKVITLHDLSLENAGSAHTILGRATLHQTLPTELTLAIEWEGEKIDLAKIKAKIYVYVSGLSLIQWLKDYSWKDWKITQGIASAKIWAIWDRHTFQKIQTAFQGYDLSLLSSDHVTHQINRLSGSIGWMREGNKQIIAGNEMLVDLPSSLWPMTNFYISLMPDATGGLLPSEIKLGYVDLKDVQSFLFSSPNLLPHSTQEILSHLKPTGNLQNMVVKFIQPFSSEWNNGYPIIFQSHVNQFSMSSWKSFPGLNHISGTINWNGTQGSLKLNSSRTSFEYTSIFKNPLYFDQLSGNIYFEKNQDNTWILRASSLQLLNPDVAANLNGSFLISSHSPLTANIDGSFSLFKASHIKTYLPLRFFDSHLSSWLSNAFLSGEVKAGHLELKGQLIDFPFEKGNGKFLISGLINDIDFRFAPDWPLMKKVNGQLVFSGQQMLVDITSGSISAIPLTKVHGEILHLGDDQPAVLTVQANDIETDCVEALKFIHHSPLEKNVGKMFKKTDMRGPMTLDLGLTVPLRNPEKVQVKGILNLNNDELEIKLWRLMLTRLNGNVQFTEDSTTAAHLSGLFLQTPIQLGWATLHKPNRESIVQANFNGHFNLASIQKWLKLPLSRVAQGATDITGQINFSQTAPIDVHLQSTLMGVTLKLPDQFSKQATDAKNATVDLIIQEKQPLKMKLSYGDLSAAFILDHQHDQYQLIGAHLQLGSGEADWPATSGLYLTGVFDRLDWDKIKGYLNQSNDSNSHFAGLSLRRIDIQTNVLAIFGQTISNLHLEVIPEKSNWKVDISSPEIVGELNVPIKLNSDSLIDAQFKKLNLYSASSTKSKIVVDVKSLPAISFFANRVQYNDMLLGRVTFKMMPISSGLSIPNFSINSSWINLQADGEWTQFRNGMTTHLQGNAISPNVSNFLNSLGFDVHNFISSKGTVIFDLNWHDAPYKLSLGVLNGRASLNLGPGRIVDIGQDSAKMDLGRMLSIFSLQSIPRRLSLNFSDVFQKGYSFDSVKGDFAFRNGSAFTNNLRFSGPVASVSINGRIGLRDKDYDFMLAVTPYITSGLPIAATLVGGPVVGLAALAVNTVVSSQVSKVTNYYYSVTGPWNQPVWKSTHTSITQ